VSSAGQVRHGGVVVAGIPANEAWIGDHHKHLQCLGRTSGQTGGGEIHGAGLIMAGGKKGLRAAVLNGGEGISVGDDNSG
jgi:hypothetical protein